MDERTRLFLMAVRQALIIVLSALEGYLEVKKTVIPKHKRESY